MYKISVPVMNCNVKRSGRDLLLKELKRLNAERVFLALDTYETNAQRRKATLLELKDNCDFLKKNGFEVGAWIWTFWVKNNTKYRNMRSISGVEIKEFVCPTDEEFVSFAADYIRDIARCGVDIIMFDDDFRYGYLSESPACLCDRHIEIINSITGESSTGEELKNHIVSGGKNKFRDAYLQANGDAFRAFAYAMRNAVDEIDSKIRLGACACLTSWDVDGVDAYELACVLAGDTIPFVRLIGAPYWAVKRNWGNCLQDVIELERMESVWTRRGDIEIMAEGDVYPRPRINCPACYLEGFDMAIRASGSTDGILKYGIDYTSNVNYETGYALLHERNAPIYDAISEVFDDKMSCGIRVYESMKKFSDMVMPTKINDEVDIQGFIFSKAARFLAANSISTVYDGQGVCGAVFDENARNLPFSALKNGLILDIAAAEILTERGIDVGIKSIISSYENQNSSIVCNMEEHFLDDDNYISIKGAQIYNIVLKDGAEILSDIQTEEGTLPLSYRYENAEGNRFLVLNINTRNDSSCMLKHYARGRQIADNVSWLSGKKLPAYVYGCPSLYLQCKQNENSLAIGLWNFFADAAINPEVELGDTYTNIRFINCDGALLGNKVRLSDIAPFSFVGLELSK